MPVIRRAERRRTETPNAVMTTLASPTQGRAGHALWRVDMRPGQAGPRHGIDAEQIWTVLDGGAAVELGGERFTVEAGDTVVFPADVTRRVVADPRTGFAAIVTAPAGMRAYPAGGSQIPTGCAAQAGDKLVPAWVV